jgi:hypothetical protein
MDGIQGAPTVTDDAVLVNSGGFSGSAPRLSAFGFDGSERWRYESGVESKSTPAVGDGAVFVATSDDVRAVELATGEERFVADAVRNEWGTVAVADGTAYVVGYPPGEERDRRLFALDTADGSVRWENDGVKHGHGPPVVSEGVVYTSNADGTLVGLDAGDGSESVTFSRSAEPVCRRGDVLYARDDGSLYGYEATTGEGLWSYRTPEIQVTDQILQGIYGVTPVDGAVYVDAADGLHGVGPVRE